MFGGIVGEYSGNSIGNCLNYGKLANSGTIGSNALIGGIAGKTWDTTIENCLSAGKIIYDKEGLIGGVLGNIDGGCDTGITHSFWTNETGYANSAGEGNYSIENSYQTELNSSVMEELNEHASKVGLSCNWIMLHLNGGRLNNGIPAYETLIATQKNFPEPVKEGAHLPVLVYRH